MKKKYAVVSCKGLGDGLISLVLSHNLYINDHEVITFHPNKLWELQSFFPHLPIMNFPKVEEIDFFLSEYEKIFVSYDLSSSFISNLIKIGKEKYKDKVFVLNPCPSRKIGGQPYYEDCYFSPCITVVENIIRFCQNILHLPKTIYSNGIILPKYRSKYPNRVIIHPTSAKLGKNWPLSKYIHLANELIKRNYFPVFVMTKEEEKTFPKITNETIKLCSFNNLFELAHFIFDSGFMVGNDSGIGHLSSLLGLPTYIIFRNYRTAKLWRPFWGDGKVFYPPKWIINFALYRLRDKKWKNFISPGSILRYF